MNTHSIGPLAGSPINTLLGNNLKGLTPRAVAAKHFLNVQNKQEARADTFEQSFLKQIEANRAAHSRRAAAQTPAPIPARAETGARAVSPTPTPIQAPAPTPSPTDSASRVADTAAEIPADPAVTPAAVPQQEIPAPETPAAAEARRTADQMTRTELIEGVLRVFGNTLDADHADAVYDLDGNGRVDGTDLLIALNRSEQAPAAEEPGAGPTPSLATIREAFGAKAGDAGYAATLDLNGDGIINGTDLLHFLNNA